MNKGSLILLVLAVVMLIFFSVRAYIAFNDLSHALLELQAK